MERPNPKNVITAPAITTTIRLTSRRWLSRSSVCMLRLRMGPASQIALDIGIEDIYLDQLCRRGIDVAVAPQHTGPRDLPDDLLDLAFVDAPQLLPGRANQPAAFLRFRQPRLRWGEYAC